MRGRARSRTAGSTEPPPARWTSASPEDSEQEEEQLLLLAPEPTLLLHGPRFRSERLNSAYPDGAGLPFFGGGHGQARSAGGAADAGTEEAAAGDGGAEDGELQPVEAESGDELALSDDDSEWEEDEVSDPDWLSNDDEDVPRRRTAVPQARRLLRSSETVDLTPRSVHASPIRPAPA
jgi:hypothetical protein